MTINQTLKTKVKTVTGGIIFFVGVYLYMESGFSLQLPPWFIFPITVLLLGGLGMVVEA